MHARTRYLGVMLAQWHHWRLFRRMHRAATAAQRSDLVFVPFLDYCLVMLGLLGSPFGSARWTGILIQPDVLLKDDNPRRGWRSHVRAWKSSSRRAALSLPTALPLFTIDPRPFNAQVTGGPPLIGLNDPVVAPATGAKDLRHELGIPENEYVVLLYGAMHLRKGVRELIESAVQYEGIHVLCAGEQAELTRQVLRGDAASKLHAARRLHVMDWFVSEEEQERLYASADLVWLVYLGHRAMSGVLMQAAMRGIPVLSQADGVMGEITLRHGLGFVANHRDPEDIAHQLQRVREANWDRTALRQRAEQAFRAHTPKAFAQCIVDSMESALASRPI